MAQDGLRISRFTWKPVKILVAVAGMFGLLYFTVHVMESFQYQAKVRQEEAKAGLRRIQSDAMRRKAESGTYEIADISAFDYSALNTQRRYSFWYAVKGLPKAIPLPSNGRYLIGLCDVLVPPETVNVMASKAGFTAAAKGNIDDDATCDEWSINDAKQLQHTRDDLHR